MKRFQNKVCLVSGAGSGIGRATALQLASEGALVCVIDINEEKGNETLKLMQNPDAGLFCKVDVGKEEDILNSVNTTLAKWKRIDVLVNNAAMMTFKKIVDLTVEEWDHVMQVNIRSVFLYCKFCIPHMQGGAIVNVSSVHAHETTANVVSYASSKGAMEAFTRGVSIEYPAAHIRINCVAPGAVDTPMLWNNPNVKSGAEKVQGAIGKPEHLAAAICFLASEEAAFINGTTLVADGGRLEIL